MQVGIHLPQMGRSATPDRVREFAQAAEAGGFDILWAVDHVVLHRDGTSGGYPYSADGNLPRAFVAEEPLLEPLGLLYYVAGQTSRIQLGTSVLIVPMREPVLHAKLMATLDYLSGGRFILGAGVGWWKEEFEALSVPFKARGKRMDECLALMRALWTEEYVTFNGEFYQLDGWACNPKPVRPIPIWLGGESPQQMRRVGQVGDGWIATPGDRPTQWEHFAVAKRAAEEAGRDPDALTISMGSGAVLRQDTMEETARALLAIREEGVDATTVLVNPRAADTPAVVEEFGRRYLADIRG